MRAPMTWHIASSQETGSARVHQLATTLGSMRAEIRITGNVVRTTFSVEGVRGSKSYACAEAARLYHAYPLNTQEVIKTR